MKSLLPKLTDSRAEEIERQLRDGATIEAVPADLHDSVMQAVQRQRAMRAVSRPKFGISSWLAWVAAPAAVCLALALFVAHSRPASRLESPRPALALSAPAATLELPQDLVGALPPALVPLSDELARVQSDFDRTAEFLVTSLP